MAQSLFNKNEGLQKCKFIKKRLRQRCFPVNITNFYEQRFYRTSQVAASANIRIIGGVATTPPKKASQIESFVVKPFTLHVYGGPDCTFAGVFNIKKLYSKY